jgi:hypothetical protein
MKPENIIGRRYRRGLLIVATSVLMTGAPSIALAADPAPAAPPAAVQTPEEPTRHKAPSFDYAQCANVCQMERDHGLTACLVADNPNKPKYSKPADCSDGGHKDYMACLKRCPTDTEN